MNLPPHCSNPAAANPGSPASHAWALLTACLLLAITLLIAGCQAPSSFDKLDSSAANPPAALPQPLDARTANYATNALQEGDIVNISFQYSTNFNAIQKITLDGMLNLDSVPPVKAAGKTIVELQSELASLYKPQIKDDVVTVKLLSSANSIYISGAVIRPGKIPMERPMTALEAIMEAGGFDPNRAKLSQVMVLRVENGKQKSYELNLKHTLEGRDDEPFYLKPFDIVHVPTKTFNF